MTVSVDLSPDTMRRLEAEAARRGVGIAAVISELVDALPAGGDTPAVDEAGPRTLAISGIGSSGGSRRARDADAILEAEGFGRS
jgi:hypothetical protein